MSDSRAYPGADANTDHNLVAAKIELKLKVIQRRTGVKRWCMSSLQSKGVQFQAAVEEELAKEKEGKDRKTESQWTRLKDAIKAGATKVFGFQKGKVAKKPWVSETIRKLKGNKTKGEGGNIGM